MTDLYADTVQYTKRDLQQKKKYVNTLCSSSQASKKASNKRQRGGQKSCSNVFSMFEQSQIQEFKEVKY